MVIVSCLECNVEVEARSRARKYCSERCRELYTRSVACDACGVKVIRSRTSAAKQVCIACRSAGGDHLPHGYSGYARGCRCAVCADAQNAGLRRFYAKRLAQDGLSYNQRLRRLKRGVPTSGTPDCSVCGEPLERWSDSESPAHKRCSDSYIPDYEAKRRAVVERDGRVCQLCLEPVDFGADWNSDWAATVDHVQPRSMGGSHELNNLRLAHRWCNSVRSDDRVEVAFFR